jgi:lysine N6-hydroxylase
LEPTVIPTFHTAAIGAGPANLSLAALMQAHTDETIGLFDSRPGPSWHPTLMQDGVRMQTSWLKDLVSMVDPTHELSFMNYLVSEGRLFALINAQFDFIPRAEYQRYLAWAAGRVRNVHYGVRVHRVAFDLDHGFTLHAAGAPVATSRHLVVGGGTRPKLPAGLDALPVTRRFLADDLALRLPELAATPSAPVAVVGGGQTGLECVLTLLRAGCTDITWFGRHQWFETIDDSPVANDFYRPAHQQFLQQLALPTRRRLIDEQQPTADALTPGGLRVLYQANYDAMLRLGRFPVTLRPGRDVTGGQAYGQDVLLDVTAVSGHETSRVRTVVVATGRENVPLPFDEELWERIETDDVGEPVVEADYSARWKAPSEHRLFLLNRSRYTHGIPDANLTLLPIRSAVVLNALFEREIFRISDELCPISWG